jgi:transposase-like protein
VPKPSAIPGREFPANEGEREQREPNVNASTSLESVPKRKRKKYSASEKLRILKAAEAAIASGERGALEALLRREGIYSSHLSAWRQQLGARGASGMAAQKPGRKPKLDEKDRELLAVMKENAKLKHKLRIANGLIDLQKKAHEILGIALPDFDETNF